MTCRDDCSGLDLTQCSINLYCLKNNQNEPVSGKSNISTNRFDFMFDTELTHGEYYLRITVSDKANNMSESEYRFVVPEEEIVGISALYEEYEKAKHENLFRSFLEERGEILDIHKYRLYVYRYGVHNKAEKTYCRSLHFSIDNQGVIFCWKEMSSIDCSGIVSLSLTESVQKNVPKNMVFTSQRMLSIEEIGPGGWAQFAALVGFMKLDNFRPKVSTPREIGVFGTYVSEGYGRTKIEDVRRWVPIKKRKSGN